MTNTVAWLDAHRNSARIPFQFSGDLMPLFTKFRGHSLQHLPYEILPSASKRYPMESIHYRLESSSDLLDWMSEPELEDRREPKTLHRVRSMDDMPISTYSMKGLGVMPKPGPTLTVVENARDKETIVSGLKEQAQFKEEQEQLFREDHSAQVPSLDEGKDDLSDTSSISDDDVFLDARSSPSNISPDVRTPSNPSTDTSFEDARVESGLTHKRGSRSSELDAPVPSAAPCLDDGVGSSIKNVQGRPTQPNRETFHDLGGAHASLEPSSSPKAASGEDSPSWSHASIQDSFVDERITRSALDHAISPQSVVTVVRGDSKTEVESALCSSTAPTEETSTHSTEPTSYSDTLARPRESSFETNATSPGAWPPRVTELPQQYDYLDEHNHVVEEEMKMRRRIRKRHSIHAMRHPSQALDFPPYPEHHNLGIEALLSPVHFREPPYDPYMEEHHGPLSPFYEYPPVPMMSPLYSPPMPLEYLEELLPDVGPSAPKPIRRRSSRRSRSSNKCTEEVPSRASSLHRRSSNGQSRCNSLALDDTIRFVPINDRSNDSSSSTDSAQRYSYLTQRNRHSGSEQDWNRESSGRVHSNPHQDAINPSTSERRPRQNSARKYDEYDFLNDMLRQNLSVSGGSKPTYAPHARMAPPHPVCPQPIMPSRYPMPRFFSYPVQRMPPPLQYHHYPIRSMGYSTWNGRQSVMHKRW
ncbi:hypothetical protein BZG36_04191 [Bifiguratus adelaidae]|uniref:Uncharacterized protein n=1 Tax=Bifiguratus adelaidae TaxID=1938954 RepID=A0A261XW71_9FUNG|nr:hypothetical protein BZG36_04191 [Bifiguratus adelaidae]